MKKIIYMLAMIIALLAICIMMAGCDIIGCAHEFERVLDREATCTEGIRYVNVCKKCEKRNGYISDAPLGHVETAIPGTEATCTTDGKTAGSYCSRCKETLVEQSTIPAAHSVIVSKKGAEPTCTEAGKTDELTCTVCTKITQQQVPISAKGHSEKQNVLNEPTCTNQGLIDKIECTVCKEILSTDYIYIPPKGHDDSDKDDICDICFSLFGDNVVEISTLDELRKISSDLNGKYRLMADISLNGEEWLSIGTKDTPFGGYFDGNGYVISDIVCSNKAEGGVFLYNSGTIANLTVKNVSFTFENKGGTVGGLVTYNVGSVKNCHIGGTNSLIYKIDTKKTIAWPNYGDVKTTYTMTCGGIVGKNSGKIESCTTFGEFVCNFSSNVGFEVKGLTLGYYSYECVSNVYFGGIVGINENVVSNSSSRQINSNTMKISAYLESDGCVYSIINAYVANLIGSNTGTVTDCSSERSTYIKDVGETSGTTAEGKACYLIMDDGAYASMIGKNDGKVEGFVALN